MSRLASTVVLLADQLEAARRENAELRQRNAMLREELYKLGRVAIEPLSFNDGGHAVCPPADFEE